VSKSHLHKIKVLKEQIVALETELIAIPAKTQSIVTEKTELKTSIETATSVIKLLDIVVALNSDIDKSHRMCNKASHQFWRRMYVRSVFAAIEGITHRLKFLSSAIAKMNSIPLSPAEQALLKEEARGGWVCLDNLKQFLSDKLLRFMPLPLSAVV